MAREITYNNFEISLVVFMANITTNHAITYTNCDFNCNSQKLSILPDILTILKENVYIAL